MTWPIIRCTPTPTDAELEAERDRKHAAEVTAWLTQQDCACGHPRHTLRCGGDAYDPHYGRYTCVCPVYREAK